MVGLESEEPFPSAAPHPQPQLPLVPQTLPFWAGVPESWAPRSEAAPGCSAPVSGAPTPAQSCQAPCAFLWAPHTPWDSELGPSAATRRRWPLPPLSVLPITPPPNPGQKGDCWELTGTHRGVKLAPASAPPTSSPHTHTRAWRGPRESPAQPLRTQQGGHFPLHPGGRQSRSAPVTPFCKGKQS